MTDPDRLIVLGVPCPLCLAPAGQPCTSSTKWAGTETVRWFHFQRHESAGRLASKNMDDASVVNKDRPNLGRAMADAYSEQREARRRMEGVARRLFFDTPDVPVADSAEFREASDVLTAAVRRLETLVHANAAHELGWAHDLSECPICTGAVNKD